MNNNNNKISNKPISLDRPNSNITSSIIQNFKYKILQISETDDSSIKVSAVKGFICRRKANMLLDSGSFTSNCLSQSFYLKDQAHFDKYSEEVPLEDNVTLSGPGNEKITFSHKRKVIVSIGDKRFKETFYVVHNLPFDVLIGGRTLQEQQIDIINSKKCVTLVDDKKKRRFLAFNPLTFFIKKETNKPDDILNKENNEISKTNPKILVLTEPLIDLPPGHETLVTVMVEKLPFEKKPQVFLIDSNLVPESQNAVYTANSINTVIMGRTRIAVANLSDNFISLGKGSVIGSGKLLENEPLLKHIEPFIAEGKDSRFINMIVSDILKEKDVNDSEDLTPEYLKKQLNNYKLPDDIGIDINIINKNQLHKLLKTLAPFKSLFAVNPDEVNSIPSSVAEHSIDTGDHKPIAQGPRRTSPDQSRVIREKIDSMLKSGIIEPSRSPWSSPILLVPKPDKKDGTKDWRFCIDFRKLNSVTKNEIYSLPRIDDCLDSLAGKTYFSTLDMASGYFQVPMKKEDKEKTSFTSYHGQYQFTRMAFGLVSAPSTYQRMMDTVLAGLKWQCLAVYIDDVIIHSKSFEEHIKDISATLTRLNEANIQIKSSKCEFFKKEVKYLGHLVSKDGIRANPAKVQKIKDWQCPKTSLEAQAFLGLAGYYRKLIPDFASYESPIRTCIKNKPFVMSHDAVSAYAELKKILSSDPVVKLPDFSGKSRFELHTDASDLGISAILTQIDENGTESVIHYASRMLSKQELKYHTQEKECLGIVWGCNKFRSYLIGTPFTIRSDHHSLQWLWRHEKGRLARWALSMSEFDYTIVHRKGIENTNADVLSRWHVKEMVDKEFDPFPYYSEPSMITSVGEENTKLIVATITENIFSEDIFIKLEKSQSNCDWIKKAIEYIRDLDYSKLTGIIPEKLKRVSKGYEFFLQDNLLVRKKRGNNLSPQILIPENDSIMQQHILSLHHDRPESAHFSSKKMLPKLLKNYYWISIRNDCDVYCKSCESCQSFKPTAPNPKNRPLKPFLPDHPNERLSIDLIGPLPETEDGYQYVLCMVDNFSKWVTAVPLKNKNQGEVADAIFKEWYMTFGLPETIHSDQGTEFVNDLLGRINERLGVGHKVTTPYYPQSNAQVERWNRTLKDSLKIFCNKKSTTWDKYLYTTCFAYNISLNVTTGFSPYFIMYGRDPRLPTDILMSTNYNEIKFDMNQYQMQHTNHLRTAYEIVKKNLEKEAISRKIRWDKNIKGHKVFIPGDEVLMFQTNLKKDVGDPDHSAMFKPKWKGPMKIISRKHKDNQDVYLIKDLETKREFTVNVHKLIKYIKRKFLTNLPDNPSEATEHNRVTVDADIPNSDHLIHRPLVEKHVDENDILLDEDSPTRKDCEPQSMGLETSDIDSNLVDPRMNKTRHITRQEQGRRLKRNKNVEQLEKENEEFSIDALESYEIEKIVGHKMKGRQLLYTIKWIGFNEVTDTPMSQIDTRDCIQEYWDDQTNKKDCPKEFRQKKIDKILGYRKIGENSIVYNVKYTSDQTSFELPPSEIFDKKLIQKFWDSQSNKQDIPRGYRKTNKRKRK